MRYLSIVLGLSLFFQASAFAVTWDDAKKSPEKMIEHLNEKKAELEAKEQELLQEHQDLHSSPTSPERGLALQEKEKELNSIREKIAYINIDIKYVPTDPQEFQRHYAEKAPDRVTGLPGVTIEIFIKNILPFLTESKQDLLSASRICSQWNELTKDQWNNFADERAEFLKRIDSIVNRGKTLINALDKGFSNDLHSFQAAFGDFQDWIIFVKRITRNEQRLVFSVIAPIYQQLIAKILTTPKPARLDSTTWKKHRERILVEIAHPPLLDSESALFIFNAVPFEDRDSIVTIFKNPSVGSAFLKSTAVTDYIGHNEKAKIYVAGNPTLSQEKYSQIFEEAMNAIQSQDNSEELSGQQCLLLSSLLENPRATETELKAIWGVVQAHTANKPRFLSFEEPKIIISLLKHPKFLSYPDLEKEVFDFIYKIKVDRYDDHLGFQSSNVPGPTYFEKYVSENVRSELEKHGVDNK